MHLIHAKSSAGLFFFSTFPRCVLENSTISVRKTTERRQSSAGLFSFHSADPTRARFGPTPRRYRALPYDGPFWKDTFAASILIKLYPKADCMFHYTVFRQLLRKSRCILPFRVPRVLHATGITTVRGPVEDGGGARRALGWRWAAEGRRRDDGA